MATARPVDLGWLVRLRWAGYLGAFLVAVAMHEWVHLSIDLFVVGILAGVGLASNAAVHVWARYRIERPATLAGILSLDVVLLSLGLASSGGLETPLILTYLVPLVIAAVTLPRWAVGVLLFETLIGLGLLAAVHPQLRANHEHATLAGPNGVAAAHGSSAPLKPQEHAALHRDSAWIGVWFVGFLVVLVVRRALADREQRLEALRVANERAERLAELSTLAASATHALGSPLSIIGVIGYELERTLAAKGASDELDDVRAILEQVERCRKVLGNMANDARTGKEPATETALLELCETAQQSAREPDRVRLHVEGGSRRAWVPRRSLIQVLTSLLENASDAAPGEDIELHAQDTGATWRIAVIDRGKQVPEGLLRLGDEPTSTKPFGMGIGLFLGRAILERLGGTLELRHDAQGTTAVLHLPTLPNGAGAQSDGPDEVPA